MFAKAKVRVFEKSDQGQGRRCTDAENSEGAVIGILMDKP